jgi:hypothetical protein
VTRSRKLRVRASDPAAGFIAGRPSMLTGFFAAQ